MPSSVQGNARLQWLSSHFDADLKAANITNIFFLKYSNKREKKKNKEKKKEKETNSFVAVYIQKKKEKFLKR